MSTYTPPALNAVDFALTAATVPDLTPAEQALSVYTPPALNAVDFALVAFTPPTYPYVGWELLPDADADILGAGQIASAEAFGDASIQAQIDSAGIATGEQFGEPLVEADAEILMAGIPSEEAFGSPQIYVRRRTSGGVQTPAPTPKPDPRRREWLRVQAKIRAEDEELLMLSAHAVASLMQEVELWEA